MTFAAMRQRILRSLFQDIDSPSQKSQDDVNLAIVEAINYHKSLPLGFNEIEETVDVYEGEKEIDWPSGFEGMSTFALYTQTDSSISNRIQIYPVQFMKEVSLNTDWSVYDQESTVRWMAVDTVNHQFILGPGDPLEGTLTYRYITDVGTIYVSNFDGTNWSYEDKDQVAINTSTFESEWFKEGFHLIYHRALYLLWSDLYGGTDESNGKAQLHLAKWNDEHMKIRSKYNIQGHITNIKGYI